MQHQFDAVVIGAGVCGALVAQRLAMDGAKVALLEAGEEGPARAALAANYVTAPAKTMNAPYKPSEAMHWVPSPDGGNDPYYDQPVPAFKSTYARRLGGSTWHWRGNVPRFIPNDFRIQSLYGVGDDWPLTYDDLEPYYCEAERELGVSGNHEQWNNFMNAYRTQPFPMSEIWSSYGDSQVQDHINALSVDGVRLRVMNTPQARNSQPYDGRPPCAGNSTCDPICPIGAKYDGTAHVKKAVAAGAVLRSQCVAMRLHVDEKGLIESVETTSWPMQNREVFRAKLFVLAAHAIESPRLLLLSAGERAPNGVANSSDLVGRCLMDHLQGQAAAMLPFPVYPFRGPPTTSGIDSFRDGAFRKSHAAFRMSIGNDGWGLVEGPYATLISTVKGKAGEPPLFGPDLPQRLRDRLSRQFRVSYSTETLPDRDNRVTLSPDKRDAFGLSLPRISFKPSDYQVAAFEKARTAIRNIFASLLATDLRFNSDPVAYSSANHVIGTCRMGADAKRSVVTPECRSHDHLNLFIVGASVFPTAGTANPTLTALAVLLRSMSTIKAALR